MVFSIFYFLLVLLFFFTPLDHIVVLTLNEEIFVIISFFIFIDLFGYKLVNFVSSFTNGIQYQVYRQFFLVYLLQMQTFSILFQVYVSLTRLFKISKIFYKKFYVELSKLDAQRHLDFNFFLINFFNFQNRALVIFENQLLFKIFRNYTVKELPNLETDLIALEQQNSGMLRLPTAKGPISNIIMNFELEDLIFVNFFFAEDYNK